jgi:hypothetical protein
MSSALSPIFSLFLFSSVVLYRKVQLLFAGDDRTQASHTSTMIKLCRPGPKHPARRIPTSEWPNVVQRVVERKEPLRIVAAVYGVSHETIRGILLHIPKQHRQQEA